MALAAVLPSAAASEPQVTIVGGADVTAHSYAWTITHRHSASLVYVEIPHFRATLFYAPQGWTTEIINLQSLDFKPGKCIAEAVDPSHGLGRGQPGRFTMLAAKSLRGSGPIVLRFADGTRTTVTAEVPIGQSTFEHWAAPLALATMFAVYLLVRTMRARRLRNRSPSQQNQPTPSSNGE